MSLAKTYPNDGKIRPITGVFRNYRFLGAWIALLVAATLMAPKLGEDWSVYLYNLQYNILPTSVFKSFWYGYFVRPIGDLTGNAYSTLLVIKLFIVSGLYFGLAWNSRAPDKLVLAAVALLIIPTVSHNYQEYLRQGTAIAIFFLASLSARGVVRLPLYALAIACHFMAVLPVLLIVVIDVVAFRRSSGFGARDTVPRERLRIVVPTIAVFSLLLILYMIYVYSHGGLHFIRDQSIYFFSGDRKNLFAIGYLVAYMAYLLYLIGAERNKMHILSFATIWVVFLFYPVVADFSRAVALVSPFHLLGAFQIANRQTRFIDVGCAAMMGIVIKFA